MSLWASRDVRLHGSACGSVPTLGGAREPDQCSGCDGTKLVRLFVPTLDGAREPDQRSGWDGTKLYSSGR